MSIGKCTQAKTQSCIQVRHKHKKLKKLPQIKKYREASDTSLDIEKLKRQKQRQTIIYLDKEIQISLRYFLRARKAKDISYRQKHREASDTSLDIEMLKRQKQRQTIIYLAGKRKRAPQDELKAALNWSIFHQKTIY